MIAKLFGLKSTLVVLVSISLLAIFVLSLTALTATAATNGVTYYVDAALGSDGNTCLSPAAACATIGGAIGKASAGDTIQIAAGIYAENLSVSVSDLTFIGAGADSAIIDGGGAGRVFSNTAAATLANLTIRNGFVATTDVPPWGGGIYATEALTLTNVTVMSNTAGSGGGIAMQTAQFLLQNSRIVSNSATGNGGGVYVVSNANVVISNTLIAANHANLSGGGIYNTQNLLLKNATIRNNIAASQSGGGIRQGSIGNLTVIASAIHHNQAGSGAAVYLQGGTGVFSNTTISENTAVSSNGGIYAFGGVITITIKSSTIAYNHSLSNLGYNGLAYGAGATATVTSSIIAHNDRQNCYSVTPPVSGGYNLSNDLTCGFLQTGDQQGLDPQLAPLGDYGGPTWTQPVLAGSPAIDAANNAVCPASDQRGVTRPVDGNNDGTATCDTGAYEARNQLSVSDAAVSEGGGSAVFNITLAPTSTQAVTVSYATMSGSATGGDDYTTVSNTLVFDPGDNEKNIAVPIVDDAADESDETFTFILNTPLNAEIIDGEGLGTIVDDDGVPSLTVADVTVTEGDGGVVNAVFEATLSPASAGSVSVDYATADGTASAGSDYIAASGTLTFTPGSVTQTVTVSVNGDGIDEGDSETFTLDLSNPVNAALADAQALATITDDESAQFDIDNLDAVQALEGDSGVTPVVFSVTLSVPAQFSATVDYNTYGGVISPATPGIDFENTSGTLTFNPGETLHHITVPVIGDIYPEGTETFLLSLSNGTVSINRVSANGAILNDDDQIEFVYLPVIMRFHQ